MKNSYACFLVVLIFLLGTNFASVIPDEDWSYSEVRPGANMFWYVHLIQYYYPVSYYT